MDVTIMPLPRLTRKRLNHDYPQFRFQNAQVSRWSPSENTIYYHSLRSHEGRITLLHELGHALSGHTSYHQDIELLAREREAWHVAREIAPRYNIEIKGDHISEALRSYRHWLYRRSHCPRCTTPGIQSCNEHLTYTCLLCNTTWHANDARQCALRRYIQ